MEVKEVIKERYCRNGFGVISEEDIEKLETEFSISTKKVKDALKECNCEIYFSRPKMPKEPEIYHEQINKFILQKDMMKPKYAQNKTLSKACKGKTWNLMREKLIGSNYGSCQICGYAPENTSVLLSLNFPLYSTRFFPSCTFLVIFPLLLLLYCFYSSTISPPFNSAQFRISSRFRPTIPIPHSNATNRHTRPHKGNTVALGNSSHKYFI